MPDQNPHTDRSHGGPGSSHQDATPPKPPEEERHGPEPRQKRSYDRSDVSGGGGEIDSHHTHDPRRK